MKYKLRTYYKPILADTITPVSVYLKVRDRFPNSILLESSDYHANDNSFSYICCNPRAAITIENEKITERFPDNTVREATLSKEADVTQILDDFSGRFEVENHDFKFITNGLFGYIAYDAVRYFESVKISNKPNSASIPDIHYAIYQHKK